MSLLFVDSMLTKRAQGRKRFGMKNFKQRYFCLTNQMFAYSKCKGGIPLCVIPIDEILAVETLQEESFKMKYVSYSKTCVKRRPPKRPKIGFQDNYHLMQVKSIAECSKGSILQYFRPSLSYHLSLRSLFCLFLSGCFTQVLLYDTTNFFFLMSFVLLVNHDEEKKKKLT